MSNTSPIDETGPTQEKLPKAHFVTKTLGELRGTLPIGVPVGGKYHRDIIVKPFRVKEMKQIGEYRAKSRAITTGKLVGHLLGVVCEQLGPYKFATMERDAEKQLSVSMMHMVDVLYAYLFARVESLGPQIILPTSCPNCRTRLEPVVDLNQMDVKVLDSDNLVDLTYDVELQDGLIWRGELRKKVTIGQPTWLSMDSPELQGESGMNVATRETEVVRNAIVAVDGIPTTLTTEDLEGMTIKDSTALLATISKNMPGPELLVNHSCPACSFEWQDSVEWGYDSFFRASSR